MAEKLLMLALSPTMDTGIIAKWIKSEGDRVASGDVLCEVETDKATMDYESSVDGVLLKIILGEGSSAAVGDLIGVVGKEGEDISDLLAEAVKQDKTDSDQLEKQEQDKPDSEQPDKPQKDQAESAGTPPGTKTAPAEPDAAKGPIRSSPLARKLADQNGLKLADIQGSGPAGRIVKSDVEQALAKTAAEPSAKSRPDTAGQTGTPATAKDVVIPVSGKRRVIATRLAESMYTAPHYYLKVPVEMDEILAARQRLNAKPDIKVSMNAFIIKFVAESLKRHPRVNATWNGDTITEHGRIDIGLAVAQKDGLITPVVRDCGSKGIVQIDDELNALIVKARKETLTPEEYTGATFTISNLGSFGIEEFTAIINPPGSAILAVGEFRKEPVVQPDDTIKIRSVMKMTLSCDHRVIDGSVGALFLTELRDMMQEPMRALY
ncbi:MAG: dihydrolipoamide acetyltransferase family protein [Bacillota bacterium]|nr:dihydrolipoamide acetyltransferase family protein [Bacillota bacterium]